MFFKVEWTFPFWINISREPLLLAKFSDDNIFLSCYSHCRTMDFPVPISKIPNFSFSRRKEHPALENVTIRRTLCVYDVEEKLFTFRRKFVLSVPTLLPEDEAVSLL